MFRQLTALMLIASAAGAQSQSRAKAGKPLGDEPRKLRAWFKGGIGVEFTVQSTAANSSMTETNGVMVSDEGTLRLVQNAPGDLLFSYWVEAVAGRDAGTVTIRLKPANPEAIASHTTVATTREFPDLKMGQAVSLEILKNPSTGEIVSDILRPTTEPQPPGSAGGAGSYVAKQQLGFHDVSLTIGGKRISPPPGWLTGAAARLYVPGHGAYYLAAYEPKSQASFRSSGSVLQRTLTFVVDGEYVEIQSKDNMLTRSERGAVWVYHDPNYKSRVNPNASDLVMADAVEYLLDGR